MWDLVIEVLEILHQDEHKPSGVGGLVEKWNVSPLCLK
jgi:hypothetical protein